MKFIHNLQNGIVLMALLVLSTACQQEVSSPTPSPVPTATAAVTATSAFTVTVVKTAEKGPTFTPTPTLTETQEVLVTPTATWETSTPNALQMVPPNGCPSSILMVGYLREGAQVLIDEGKATNWEAAQFINAEYIPGSRCNYRIRIYGDKNYDSKNDFKNTENYSKEDLLSFEAVAKAIDKRASLQYFDWSKGNRMVLISGDVLSLTRKNHGGLIAYFPSLLSTPTATPTSTLQLP